MAGLLAKNKHSQAEGNYYKNSWEHYRDELRRLDLLILFQLTGKGEIKTPGYLEQLKGLVISEEEVADLLQEDAPPAEVYAEQRKLLQQLAALEQSIASKRLKSNEQGVFLPIVYLTDIFGLSYFEEQCILICLAVELDRKYEKLYGFLQDDVTCKIPTVGLILDLLCPLPEDKLAFRYYFGSGQKLCRYFLKSASFINRSGSLLSRTLQLDERVVEFLLHGSKSNDFLSFYTLINPDQELPPLLLEEAAQKKLRDFTASCYEKVLGEGKNIIFFLQGSYGTGKKLQVRHFCRHFKQPLLLVDLEAMQNGEQPFKELLTKVLRETIMQQAVLCLENFQVLLEKDEDSRSNLSTLLAELDEFSGLIFLLSKKYWKPAAKLHRHVFIHLTLSTPREFERKKLWEHFAGQLGREKNCDWGSLAGKFVFTPGQIKNALQTADNLAVWSEGATMGMEELHRACYAQVQHRLEKKATRIEPVYDWKDIILPPEQQRQLQNACNQMKYRHVVYGDWGFGRKFAYGKGLTMLFAGPPGTGKTMAAQVVARELYLEIYKIDLSQVMSKYIGETEKNLQEIFDEAQFSNAILFFDEADALFGKRTEVKDAKDKYANVETAFLLQKMEEYEGISILATNLMQNMDEAFLRRLSFVIKFPFPPAEYRERIWRSLFPEEAPLGHTIDFRFLAERFEITGGHIKNIVLAASFLAAEKGGPITMEHIISAARYEMQKSGKVLLKEDLGEYYNSITG